MEDKKKKSLDEIKISDSIDNKNFTAETLKKLLREAEDIGNIISKNEEEKDNGEK